MLFFRKGETIKDLKFVKSIKKADVREKVAELMERIAIQVYDIFDNMIGVNLICSFPKPAYGRKEDTDMFFCIDSKFVEEQISKIISEGVTATLSLEASDRTGYFPTIFIRSSEMSEENIDEYVGKVFMWVEENFPEGWLEVGEGVEGDEVGVSLFSSMSVTDIEEELEESSEWNDTVRALEELGIYTTIDDWSISFSKDE